VELGDGMEFGKDLQAEEGGLVDDQDRLLFFALDQILSKRSTRLSIALPRLSCPTTKLSGIRPRA
jgi:hypothetical protein